MAVQIQDLVASIRRDGVDAARKDAEKIIEEAKARAEEIISDARKEAAAISENAKRDIAVREQSARAKLSQASRDVMLSLKKAMGEELGRLLETKIEKAMEGRELAALIREVVKSGLFDAGRSEVQVDRKRIEALSLDLKASLASELKSGLVIRGVDTVTGGFRVADKDGSGFYNFSDEEIARMMKPFLGEDLADLVFSK